MHRKGITAHMKRRKSQPPPAQRECVYHRLCSGLKSSVSERHVIDGGLSSQEFIINNLRETTSSLGECISHSVGTDVEKRASFCIYCECNPPVEEKILIEPEIEIPRV